MAKREKTAQGAGGWKKKVDDKSRPNHTSLPTPPSNNDPNTSPSLPIEVLRSILSHLRYDTNKTSLARCMRVSTKFKALAAPLLYEKLDWKDWKEGRWPVVSKNRGNGRGVVQAESNVDDLRLIKTVEIEHHFVKDCPRSFGARYRRQPLDLSILQITANQTQGEGVCIEGLSCSLLAELAPRKIIVRSNGADDSNSTVHWGRINQDNVPCHVLHLDLSDSRGWGRPYLPFVFGTKRLIVVLTPPKQYMATDETPSAEDQVGMDEVAIQLSIYCQIDGAASEIVLVNFGVLATLTPGLTAEVFAMICTRSKHVPMATMGPWRSKTPEEINLVTFTPVSLREYLTTYDWSGEYTEEEAAEMLAEEIEEERAAEIEEATEGPVE